LGFELGGVRRAVLLIISDFRKLLIPDLIKLMGYGFPEEESDYLIFAAPERSFLFMEKTPD